MHRAQSNLIVVNPASLQPSNARRSGLHRSPAAGSAFGTPGQFPFRGNPVHQKHPPAVKLSFCGAGGQKLQYHGKRAAPQLDKRPVKTVLPIPPDQLTFGKVSLRFERMLPGDPSRGMVPAYHFRILNPQRQDIGHINFRVGDTPHVRIAAGHIGFAINEPFRGHHYALQACQAIAPFVRQVYPAVTITCNPDNHASRRTIEKLGARFMDHYLSPRKIRNT